MSEHLSLERIILARETLTAAFGESLRGTPGAIDQDDPAAVFAEAKRNLTAMVLTVHGTAAWEAVLKEDES